MKTKILLSTLTTLVLLLNGCGGNNSEGEVANPPVVINPDPKEPSDPVEPTDPKPPVDPYKPAGWYGKTQVSATASDGKVYTHTTAGIFGELVQSDDAKDQHDIKSYGLALFQVVFPQTEWDVEDNGYYFSDYKNYEEGKKVWTFELRHDLPYDSTNNPVDLKTADINIIITGIFDVTYKDENGRVDYKESTTVNQETLNALHLVDVDNATSYTLQELATVSLNMDGKTVRTFKWVYGTVDLSDYMKPEVPMSKFASFSKVAETASLTTMTANAPTGGKFGLPPQ